MNTSRYSERSTCYSQKAGATRSARAKAGLYPTKAQKLAFKALMSVGEKYLNREALELLATHPHMTVSQRQRYSELAQAAA